MNTNKMKRVEYTQYGQPEVLQLKKADIPTPADNEVLIRIYATTVTATEATFRKGEPYFSRLFTGLTKPKITTLGEELAGEVNVVRHAEPLVGVEGTGIARGPPGRRAHARHRGKRHLVRIEEQSPATTA